MTQQNITHQNWTKQKKEKNTREGTGNRGPFICTSKNPTKTLNWKPLYICKGPDVDLCWPCACCVSLCEFICPLIILILWGLVLLISSIHFVSCTLSASYSTGFPDPWGEGYDGDIPFSVKYSKVSQSMSCGVSLYLLLSSERWSFSKDGWARQWSTSIAECC